MSKQILFLGKVFLIILITFSISSCNRSNKQAEEISVDDFTVSDDIFEDISTAKKIFYSLPSPLETAVLIKNAGAEYSEQLLNPLENADNYTTNKKMALNLGVYTTDLSYASLFDQPQTSINYMNASKKMADGLGILDAIDEATLELLSDNLDNKEKIMDIISETFMSSSSYLKDNNRPEIATIVLIGGWMEGLYLATTLVGDKPIEDNKLVDRIVEQRLSYDILMKLMNEYGDDENIQALKAQLVNFDAIMKKIVITSGEVETEKDTETNVTTLKVENKVTITKEIFDSLTKEVKTIRNDFIL